MGNRPTKPGWITAKTAAIHDLYEKSVQCPEAEIDLVLQAWGELRGRAPLTLREDFCGTSAVAREWVQRGDQHAAIGVDLDSGVIGWAQERADKELTIEQRSRVSFVEQDIVVVKTDPVDCVLAMNFSYYGIKDRNLLLTYFSSVLDGLVDDGLFLLDAYGGSDSFLEIDEERDFDGFTYVWDQHYVNPITGSVVNYIHFEFPNGSKIFKVCKG